MEKVKRTFLSARNIATLGILLALVIILQAFGGSFSIGLVTLNFSLIPIVLGALVLGPAAGALLGLANGIVVLVQVIIAPAGFYFFIWTYSPVVTTLICLLKTTVAGFVGGLLFRVISRKNTYIATFVASASVPVINTLLFVLGCLCMPGTINAFQESIGGYSGMNIFVFICVVLVTFNFFIELAINLVVSPALHTVYRIVEKQYYAGKAKKKTVLQEENNDNLS